MVKIETKKGVEEMSVETFARWACLIEAMDFISSHFKLKNKKGKNVDWVKPLAFHNYIEERFPSMLHDVRYEHQRGLI